MSPDQRIAIYKNRLKWIPDDEIEDRRALETALESSPMARRTNKANGRQIRNIVTGARAWAKQHKEKLTLSHLVKVDDATQHFIEKMADIVQKQRARNEVDFDR